MNELNELHEENDENVYDKSLIKHFFFTESDNISHRTDWFIIFHGVLFQAYISCTRFPIKMVVGYIGALIGILWLMSGIRTYKLLWQAGNYMQDKQIAGSRMANTFRKIFSERKSINNKFYGWARPAPLFSIITPAIFTIAWTVVLVLDFSLSNIIVIVITIIILVFLIAVLVNRIEGNQKNGNTTDTET